MTSTRFAIFAVFALSACDVGTFGSGGGGGGVDDSMCKDRVASPVLLHTHTTGLAVPGSTNVSNAGEGCVKAACHLASSPGPSAPAYTYAGTLYADTAGTMPQAGAWVRIRDDSGNVVETATDSGGNFFFDGANVLPTPYPGHTSAALCTTAGTGVSPMTDTLAVGGGDCNQGSSCHGNPTGGTKGTTILFITN